MERGERLGYHFYFPANYDNLNDFKIHEEKIILKDMRSRPEIDSPHFGKMFSPEMGGFLNCKCSHVPQSGLIFRICF